MNSGKPPHGLFGPLDIDKACLSACSITMRSSQPKSPSRSTSSARSLRKRHHESLEQSAPEYEMPTLRTAPWSDSHRDGSTHASAWAEELRRMRSSQRFCCSPSIVLGLDGSLSGSRFGSRAHLTSLATKRTRPICQDW